MFNQDKLGIFDKHKTEIKEGDIVEYKLLASWEPCVEVVEYSNGGFHPFYQPGKRTPQPNQCEIKGNIWEQK
jgi:hypothetical protein